MFVLFCHVMYGCFLCILYAYTCMYLCICIFVCVSVQIYACVYVCVGTLFYLYKSYLFNCLSCRYLVCYLLVWHCYLGSILAFSFEFQNLNTTMYTKTSNKLRYLGNINS